VIGENGNFTGLSGLNYELTNEATVMTLTEHGNPDIVAYITYYSPVTKTLYYLNGAPPPP
jgi:hypothetical protein